MTSSDAIVGHYEIGKPLGKGTFSSVRECTDTKTGKQYAVKILDKQVLLDRNLGAQVNREICVMLKMSHKNVCTMRECFQTPDKVYIILELIKGGELFERIKKDKRLDEDSARNYFQQLILGLKYCHKNGIAHRDLKPENLLLDEEGTLKLSDFGLSNTQPTSNSGKVPKSMMLYTICGTPNYVAPEVLGHSGYNGFKADMWSCGVILYVMLSGCLPFFDADTHQLFKKIQSGIYNIPEYFSQQAIDLIAKLLKVDPNERSNIDDVLQDPWFRVGWNDDWLLEGELKRTPSQERIAQTVAQLREQRESRERANSESKGSTPSRVQPRGARKVVPKPEPSTPETTAANEVKEEEDELTLRKQKMDKLLEAQRKELEDLRIHQPKLTPTTTTTTASTTTPAEAVPRGKLAKKTPRATRTFT